MGLCFNKTWQQPSGLQPSSILPSRLYLTGLLLADEKRNHLKEAGSEMGRMFVLQN